MKCFLSESIYSITVKCENSVKKHYISHDIFENFMETSRKMCPSKNFSCIFPLILS